MFKELTDKINYSEVERENLKYWEEKKIFEESISSRNGKPLYTFYEGPPTANGKPGIHHIMARALKDSFCRYKTMSGYQVHRKAGWDTHGLPVEIEVEKQIGIKHKDEILDYGVEKFNKACRESVWKYKTEWEQMTREMGYWVDLSDPYITFHNNYIESIWWALKRYYDENMIYRGYKIQPYCPRCETPLSSHEVALGYKDVKDPSVYVKMKVKDETNTYFLVWTTTPWTLISNVALAVHPEIDYVKVELLHAEGEETKPTGEYFILAKARLEVLKDKYAVVKEFKGKDLLKKEYERIFNYHQVKEKGWYVVEGSFVTTDSGSGIVHMAPAYGEDDYQTCRKYGLPTIHPVNKSGEFEDAVTDFKGKFVKDADADIILNLKTRNILYKKESYQHSYPHCWRCSSPLLYYARDSWYIRTTEYAKRMIDLNKQINWIPKEVGEGRFGNWLEENKDWALSRDRYWGTPLPIWMSEDGQTKKCIGSFEELIGAEWLDENGKPTGKIFSKEDLKTLDPHKPVIDRLAFKTSDGTYLRRTQEVIDAWFDSGSMPFAQWHYPFENKDIFDKAYPADFISEGIDQTRGWFYTLHSIGTFLSSTGAFGETLKNKPAYRNVLVNELILDKSGQKMSKSKGNTVDPFSLIHKYGADATRWYLVSNSPVWRPTLFDEEGIGEVQRKFFSTLVNTYSFFALYANIDKFDFSEPRIPVNERAEIDRWIISALNTLTKQYTQYMDEYDITKAARAVSDFTLDNLSNWYVRRNRRRFWKSEKGRDKTAAYQTLYECLESIVKMTAPIAPFLADEIYRTLNSATKKEAYSSVHLSYIPKVDTGVMDAELEERMEYAIRIVGLVRAMRVKSNLKVRQPLQKIILPINDERHKQEVIKMEDVILEEINVKEIEFVTDDSGIVKKKAKPNFRTLGQKFGKQVQEVAAKVREMTSADISHLQKAGVFEFPHNGSYFSVAKEDVEILHEDLKGWLVETDGTIMVALDTEITPELRSEGFAREFVNRVQNLRKDSGLEVTDRISIIYSAGETLKNALGSMMEYVKRETLAVELKEGTVDGRSTITEDINGEACDISIKKITS
ncbi:MAG: isoleucine--tRNA ligase [Ignavibacteriales bacterium]|nr:isoleucine--tRNA ligase [Ignavibacteriales bacterium]